jgi:hypothetical protein
MSLVDETRTNAAALEDEGRRIGAALDSVNAVTVVARAPDDAAAVALGIGAMQARQRRVVVADLAGDTPALTRLVASDDPHGLSDSFRYGVSLNRVAHLVGDGGNLFVLPSGTEPVADEEIYRSDRWRRLVAGFREVGALLVLVARDDAPALDTLVAFTDGAVAVGGIAVPGLVLETASLPRPARGTAATAAPALDASDGSAAPAPRRIARRPLVVAAGLVAAAIVAMLIFRLRTGAPAAIATRDTTVLDSVTAVTAVAAGRSVDSASAAVAPETPPIRNPADSALATAYGVEIAKFSTPTGALMRVRDELPRAAGAATFGVVAIGSDATLWYRVLAGADVARAAADSALAALRAAKVIDDPAAGAVVRVPFAFRLRADVAPDSAHAVAAGYLAHGVPAYPLLQADGTATIYAGAVETADQAALFMTYLRAAGIEPALTYRLGRAL